MMSYIKNLDMCENVITFTFFGNYEKYKDLHKYVKNKFCRGVSASILLKIRS